MKNRERVCLCLLLILFCNIGYSFNIDFRKNLEERFNKINTIDIESGKLLSTDLIANYISNNYDTDDERILATYKWIADNISYDLSRDYSGQVYTDISNIAIDALKNKQGVCIHFSVLFDEVLNKMGINSHVIYGYTPQSDTVSVESHAWNAVLLYDDWYLFDITWASGYVLIDKGHKSYQKRYDLKFIYADYDDFAKTHVAYDPIWNFKNNSSVNKKMLVDYNNASDIEKLLGVVDRVSKYVDVNPYVRIFYENRKQELDIRLYNSRVERLNKAVEYGNKGVVSLNTYVDYFNSQFHPSKSKNEVLNMLFIPKNEFDSAMIYLNSIKGKDQNLENKIKNLELSYKSSMTFINKQLKFVDEYFSKPSSKRKMMFVKTIR